MTYSCPACHRTIANRALTQCSFCGAMIPDNLRYTPAEISALEKLKADLQQDQLESERMAAEQGWWKKENHSGVDLTGLM